MHKKTLLLKLVLPTSEKERLKTLCPIMHSHLERQRDKETFAGLVGGNFLFIPHALRMQGRENALRSGFVLAKARIGVGQFPMKGLQMPDLSAKLKMQEALKAANPLGKKFLSFVYPESFKIFARRRISGFLGWRFCIGASDI